MVAVEMSAGVDAWRNAGMRAVQADVFRAGHDQLPFIALRYGDQRVDMMLRGEESKRNDDGGEHAPAAGTPTFRQCADRCYEETQKHRSHRQDGAVGRVAFRGDQTHGAGKYRQAEQRGEPNDAARTPETAPFHEGTRQQKRPDKGRASQVQG